MRIITGLDPALQKTSAQAIARAFFNYPMMRFYFPDDRRRARYLPWYMGLVQQCGLRYGEVYAAADGLASAGFLLPGHTKLSMWEYLQNGFYLAPLIWNFPVYARAMECEEYVEKCHAEVMADRPHYYLWWLAVDPTLQGQGLGSALLKPGLEKASAENRPVYLETHEEKNVRYYQKRGFTLAKAARDPKYDLPFWCMVKEPVIPPAGGSALPA